MGRRPAAGRVRAVRRGSPSLRRAAPVRRRATSVRKRTPARLGRLGAPARAESRGPVDALRRSVELVRGSWWRICGISLLAFVIASIAGMVFQQLFNAMGVLPRMFESGKISYEPTFGEIFAAVSGYLVLALVGQLVSQIFSTTFPQLVLNLLYIDQRIRRENLAPALIAAAGTPPP